MSSLISNTLPEIYLRFSEYSGKYMSANEAARRADKIRYLKLFVDFLFSKFMGELIGIS